MKANAVNKEQQEDRKDFIKQFDNLYSHIGNQEMNERAVLKSKKANKKSKGSFMSKNFNEDAPAQKKSGIGSIFSGLFGGSSKSKPAMMSSPVEEKMAMPQMQEAYNSDSESENEEYIPQKQSGMMQQARSNRMQLGDELSAGLFKASQMKSLKKK